MKKSGPSEKIKKKTGVINFISIKKNKKTKKKKTEIFSFMSIKKKKKSKKKKEMEDSKFSKVLKFWNLKGKRIVFLIMLMMVMVVSLYTYHRYTTYNSIQIIVKDGMALEYGTPKYDIHDFIEGVEGKIVSVKNEVDTGTVGKQEIVLEVKKENIVKDVPIVVSVVDTVDPVIELKEEKMTITRGDDCNLLTVISSVTDEVDGNIPYDGEAGEGSKFYYNFAYDSDSIGNVGEHEIKVLATDKNGNTAEKSFTLEVVAPKRTYYQPVYYNLPANGSANDLVSIAYSLIGAPYGISNGPYSFDCSGFVQYVYSRVGISISRSSSTQLYDGYPVRYEDMQPGDIIIWGYSGGYATHSSMYVGGGQMIHSANWGTGVIVNSVDFWLRGSGTQILSIRRIQ